MGPKKKGGKANKLARMTDEQRERYLQHRAAIEEETRRRKEQLIATFMRNKLKREEAFTRINSAKINQHWRHILRKIKCAELREDVESLWHGFERIMHQKQRHKEELLSSLEVADRQYFDTLQSHMEVVQKLIEVHSEHVLNLQALFNKQIAELLNSAINDNALICVTFEQENQKLQVIQVAMEMEFNSRERKRQKSDRIDKLSELKRKYKDDWAQLIAEREGKLEDVWQQMQDCLQSYSANTAAKRKTIQLLQNCDQGWIHTLAHIQHTSRRVTQMKEQAENKINDLSERNENIKKDRDSLLNCYKTLVERGEKERKRDDDKFHHLVVASERNLKSLEAIRNKGEKALALAVLCQRQESNTERHVAVCTQQNQKKVYLLAPGQKRIPKPPQKEHSKTVNLLEDHESGDNNEDLEEKELRVFGKLNNFWKRYNKVLIETSNMRMERDILALENQKLCSTLREYLLEMARVDSCGAPTGHRIVTGRPHTSRPSHLTTTIKVPQRPLSSVSCGPSTLRAIISPYSKHSLSRTSSSLGKASDQSHTASAQSSNSDLWSLKYM